MRLRRLVLLLSLVVGATAAPTSAGAVATRPASGATTVLTVQVPRCTGCKVTAHTRTGPGALDVWNATATPRNGSVTFRVPTAHTRGLTLSVKTPWEGLQGYVTKVAMRYGGLVPGQRVGLTKARAQRRATACWAGTTEPTATLALGIRQVRVRGLVGEVRGTIAWARTTTDWVGPMRRAPRGVLGKYTPEDCDG